MGIMVIVGIHGGEWGEPHTDPNHQIVSRYFKLVNHENPARYTNYMLWITMGWWWNGRWIEKFEKWRATIRLKLCSNLQDWEIHLSCLSDGCGLLMWVCLKLGYSQFQGIIMLCNLLKRTCRGIPHFQTNPCHFELLGWPRFLNKSLVERMSKGGIIANVQPQFVPSDLPIIKSRVGEGRVFGWNSLITSFRLYSKLVETFRERVRKISILLKFAEYARVSTNCGLGYIDWDCRV